MTILTSSKKMQYRKALLAKKIRFAGLTDEQLTEAHQKYCLNLTAEANTLDEIEEGEQVDEKPKPKGRPRPTKAPAIDVPAITKALEALNAQTDTKQEIKELFKQVDAEMVTAENAFANVRALFTQYI